MRIARITRATSTCTDPLGRDLFVFVWLSDDRPRQFVLATAVKNESTMAGDSNPYPSDIAGARSDAGGARRVSVLRSAGRSRAAQCRGCRSRASG
jgi:hypothetical protein